MAARGRRHRRRTVVSLIGLAASGARVATPVSEAFYEAAYTFGYGYNIVNVTLVDIRAWDTLGEISVLVVAATGVASLIFIRRRYSELPTRPSVEADTSTAGRMTWLRGRGDAVTVASLDHLRGGHPAALPGDDRGLAVSADRRPQRPGGGFAGGLVAGMALIIRYLAGGSRELDEAAPVDAGRVLGAGLLLAGLSALAPVLVGGRIVQSLRPRASTSAVPGQLLTPLGPAHAAGRRSHLVTSVFFDIGVYLVVIGVMLDLARSLGSGIDQHEAEDRTPAPQSTLRSRATAATGGTRAPVVTRREAAG